jgi:cytochrome c oxidase assembly factor CtaG
MTLIGADQPYAWEPHAASWGILAALVGAVVLGHRRLKETAEHPIPWGRRQIVQFSGAVVASVVALTWPVADLAAHWSLTALVVQRVIVVLAVAPLLYLGLPYDLLQWATRPAAVDAVLLRLQRPLVAIVTVSVLMVGSMVPGVVHAQSTSALVRAGVTLMVLVAGLVLWLPVLGRIPGLPRPKPVVRFAYLVAQAVVPAFLSFIFIFSTHPLYDEFARAHAAVGLRPLNDQQVAGFVAKLSMLLVLLTVGWVVLSRASTSDDEFANDEPLVWADVERHFERVDRQGARADGGVAPRRRRTDPRFDTQGPSAAPAHPTPDQEDPGSKGGRPDTEQPGNQAS